MRIYDQESSWELSKRPKIGRTPAHTEVYMGPGDECSVATVTGPNHEELARLIEHLPSFLSYVAEDAGDDQVGRCAEALKLLEKAFDVRGLHLVEEALEL